MEPAERKPGGAAETDPSFEGLLEFLREERGFDFTGYKRATLLRRVKRRMEQVGIHGFAPYTTYLEAHVEEFPALFDTILINVTEFFRDAAAWSYLIETALPPLLAASSDAAPFRVWSAGCASGQEAYTIAMVLAEMMGPDRFLQRVKIYATDVDEDALATARHGYSERAMKSVPPELLTRYFEVHGARYTFRGDLRRALVFGRHDLVSDAPISKIDLIACRNTLMYMMADTQGRILGRLHYALNDSGLLFVGKAEMLLTHPDLFTPDNLKHRVFKKVPVHDVHHRIRRRARVSALESWSVSQQEHLRDQALDHSPVAQLAIDGRGALVTANEEARRIFGIELSDLGRPFKDLEISYRPLELRSRLDEARQLGRTVEVAGVEARSADGQARLFDVSVSPLQGGGGDVEGFSVTFADVTRYMELQRDLERSRHDLEMAYEELQSANEELQTTNEELQSTVEELETTNEELQSSNEELETMNEELESTNSELQTINSDLDVSSSELGSVRRFTDSVLTSLRLAVIAMGPDEKVRMWNAQAQELWGIRADEAVGQPFFSLDIGLPVEQLRDQVRDLLEGRSNYSESRLDAVDRRGRSIRVRVVGTAVAEDEGGVALLIDLQAGGAPGQPLPNSRTSQ